MQHNGTQLMW